MTEVTRKPLTAYLGRFSPGHVGHFGVLKRALLTSERVLVIVGSADRPRTLKNPWTAQERAGLIRAWYNNLKVVEPNIQLAELIVTHNRDFLYNNNRWLKSIQEKIAAVEADRTKVWITGADRDKSTWYLKELSALYNMDLVEENRDVSLFLSATTIREIYFGKEFNHSPIGPKDFDLLMRSFVPGTTLDFLNRFMATPEYNNLLDQYHVVKKRQEGRQRRDGHATVDVTIDNVVIQTGHVLLVKRRSHPGKGLWALPGGYLEEKEWTFDGSLRELDEETKLKVPPNLLRNSLAFDHWFDHPDRSEVGRVITHAFCFKLPDFVVDGKIQLPRVKGADANGEGKGFDDAEKMKWFTFNEVEEMSSMLFDDHFDIIEDFLGRDRTKGDR